MMHWFTSIFMLASSIVLSQDSWGHIRSVSGAFELDCPVSMTEKVIKSETPIGTLEYHTFIAEQVDTAKRSTIYMVSYVDYPPTMNLKDSLDLMEVLFQVTIEEATQSVGGQLIYSQDDYSYSLPGKIWRINYLDGEAFIKSKAFYRDNRYYHIQLAGTVGKSYNLIEEHFFNSFKLIP